MDPTECLAEIRRLTQEAHERFDGTPDAGSPEYDLARLAELVDSLDDWIISGGFLPTSWQVTRTSAGDFSVTRTMSKWSLDGMSKWDLEQVRLGLIGRLTHTNAAENVRISRMLDLTREAMR